MPDLNKAYQWAVNTCNAPNVGYSQDYRNQEHIGVITYYDCSSFINYALIAGGWVTPQYAPAHNPLTTWSLITELPRLGWSQVDPNGLILPGDIGVSNIPSSHHTEMAYNQGNGQAIFMGAHGSKYADGTPIPLDYQVSIGDSYGNAGATKTFETLWRYGEGGAEGYGYSLPVIAAICGNAWKESQINPGLEESNGIGYGLFQWSFERRTAFETWMTQNGFAFDDPNGQVQYLMVENYWNVERAHLLGYPFESLTEFLESTSTDIEMLTRAWEDCWEISGDDEQQIQQRIDWANECYAYISAHAQDTSIFEWYISSNYITDTQTLNNAVMLYRILSTGGGGGTLGKAKQMPLWMKIRYHY